MSLQSMLNAKHLRNKISSSVDYLRLQISRYYAYYPYSEVTSQISFNRILDNQSRSDYQPVIDQMKRFVPSMMNRKISEANVQQAFVLDSTYKFIKTKPNPKILCVGSYEDTAAASLKMLGYRIVEIDPEFNYDLDTYFHLPTTVKESYDVIFSTSVIEHVRNDETFIQQISELLCPGGIGILTCDYNDNYKIGDKSPKTNIRFYTKKDLEERLIHCAIGCSLIDKPLWDESLPDFIYDGCQYSFATLTFQKNQ